MFYTSPTPPNLICLFQVLIRSLKPDDEVLIPHALFRFSLNLLPPLHHLPSLEDTGGGFLPSPAMQPHLRTDFIFYFLLDYQITNTAIIGSYFMSLLAWSNGSESHIFIYPLRFLFAIENLFENLFEGVLKFWNYVWQPVLDDGYRWRKRAMSHKLKRFLTK